jgi:CubicO group peptidase (beta-lactamase class C family)
MKNFQILTILIGFLTFSCSSTNDEISNENEPDLGLYFPQINSNEWETLTVTELGWNNSAVQPLIDFLGDSNTKAFIILKNGKIVIESYQNGHAQDVNWYWASAGKTLTAFTLGIVQSEGFLSLSDASRNYLGNGWSSLTIEQEEQISILNHISMTTGLDYTAGDNFCTDTNCLTYLNAPGTYWYYHNAPYTLTQSIISGAMNSDFNTYFNEKLRDRIGMNGNWFNVGYNILFFSNARSMARFGLLCLNKGVWDSEIIFNDHAYFNSMMNTSQNHNEAYGYLWWLNGKNSYRLPGSTSLFQGKLIPNAPNDLVAGLGANDQKLYIIPSKNLVIVRMGNDSGEGELGPSGFDNLLWEKINAVID